MSDTEREGVIKYDLRHAPGTLPSIPGLAELDAWRTVLHRLGLVGQRPDRYGGYGFGNVSLRVPDPAGQAFVISGTQTGAPERLGASGYARVQSFDIAANRIVSTGTVKPSSEALTHAAVYAAAPAIRCVLHVHCPDIWQAGDKLPLPSTAADIPYGTPAMAVAVADLLDQATAATPVFTMRGHEDGVIACGSNLQTAGTRLVSILADALKR